MLIVHVVLFIILLFLLGFFRGKIAHYIQRVSLLLFNTITPGIVFYSLFFLPGVLLHELSHLLMAEILGVRTGNINIFPSEIKSGQVKMGYVESEETDPARSMLIGIAPLLTGLLIIFGVVFWRFNHNNLQDYLSWSNLVFLYLIFSIGNTMFVSSEDRRGFWFIPILIIAFWSLVNAFQITIKTTLLITFLDENLFFLNKALILCLALDLIFWLLLRLTKNISEHILDRRLAYKS